MRRDGVFHWIRSNKRSDLNAPIVPEMEGVGGGGGGGGGGLKGEGG